MLNISKARTSETNEVIQHYKTVINQIQNNKHTPGWIFGIHPTEEHIKNAIKNQELIIGKVESKIVASLILDKNPLEANDKIQWSQNHKKEEISFIHLVAVNQEYKNMGFAKQMLNHTFKLAKNNKIKSIRLSLNIKNLIIENLYLKTGFNCMGTEEVFIEKRGNITFNLYEKII